MKKWCFLLAALLLLPLSACGGIEDESYLRGRVAEVQRDSDGSPSALILDTGDGEREGVFWDEYTRVAVSQAVEEVLAGESFQALIPLGTELTVDLRPDAEGKSLTAQDGTEFPDAGTADFLTVEEIPSPESLTLSDGTEAEIWVGIGGGPVLPPGRRDGTAPGASPGYGFFHLLCGGGHPPYGAARRPDGGGHRLLPGAGRPL